MTCADPAFRPVRPDDDAVLLHRWVTHPRSVFWEMVDADVGAVRAAYDEIDRHPHHHAWLGGLDGRLAVLCETYDPARSELVGLVGQPDLEPGDVGMHVLVAPPEGPTAPGFTRRAFAAVMRHCFGTCAAQRVVVEPDVDNTAIAAINAAAGFTVHRRVDLGHKTAALSTCTPAAFAASEIGHL
jgi:RimJ/RimL family protein N-acetyltransferase